MISIQLPLLRNRMGGWNVYIVQSNSVVFFQKGVAVYCHWFINTKNPLSSLLRPFLHASCYTSLNRFFYPPMKSKRSSKLSFLLPFRWFIGNGFNLPKGWKKNNRGWGWALPFPPLFSASFGLFFGSLVPLWTFPISWKNWNCQKTSIFWEAFISFLGILFWKSSFSGDSSSWIFMNRVTGKPPMGFLPCCFPFIILRCFKAGFPFGLCSLFFSHYLPWVLFLTFSRNGPVPLKAPGWCISARTLPSSSSDGSCFLHEKNFCTDNLVAEVFNWCV